MWSTTVYGTILVGTDTLDMVVIFLLISLCKGLWDSFGTCISTNVLVPIFAASMVDRDNYL